jgi:hypothetical protein
MQPPVFYRSVDPVENLRVRIIVKQVKGSSALATAAAADGAPSGILPGGTSVVTDTTRAGASGAPSVPFMTEEVYDRTFEWQKKVFSPR